MSEVPSVYQASNKKAAQSGLLAEADAAVAALEAGAAVSGADETSEAAVMAAPAGAITDPAEAALAAPSGVSAGKVCNGGGGSTATGSASGRIHAATAKAATNKAAIAPSGVLFFCSFAELAAF